MSTLQERLAIAMKGPPLVTAADLARACNVKPASVSEWINGPTKTLRGPNAISAARCLGVNNEWLSTGRGPMRVGDIPITNAPDDLARALLAKASPRSHRALTAIIEAAQRGKLTDADIELLGVIAKRFQQ